LFAIRIVLNSPLDKEKPECWQAYSIVTDLYTPNPKRLKDWLSIPKSNGYESLHTTVMGHESRWVEVQIRTRRMDEIAERGLAAHWKYKGVKSQSKMDDWLTGLREMLENKSLDSGEKLENFKLDLYDDEIMYLLQRETCINCRMGQQCLTLHFLYTLVLVLLVFRVK
jgi:Guanosine polyphosphate pyrophosphohydrolases/synthetases